MNSDRIKVLHTENAMDYTGGFKALYDYIKAENDRVESIVVLPVGSKCKKRLEEIGVKVYEIPFLEISKSAYHLFFYIPFLVINAWKIRKIARQEKIDLLHANDMYNLTLHLVKHLFRYDKPLVVHIRLMPSSFPKSIYYTWRKINLALADSLIVVSKAVKKVYGTSSKIHQVYDVVSLPEAHPRYIVDYFPSFGRPFRFLYLANFTPGKGQELAVQAFHKFYKKNKNATITFAGGDLGRIENMRFKEQLQKTVFHLGLEEKVIFEDFVKDTELKMKQYDCIVNFSLSESFSFTSYDALRFGIPLIVSDCGGPEELFENGKSGILVENGNINDLAEAMRIISTHSELASSFSVNSRLHIADLIDKSNGFEYLSKLFISLSKTGK